MLVIVTIIAALTNGFCICHYTGAVAEVDVSFIFDKSKHIIALALTTINN